MALREKRLIIPLEEAGKEDLSLVGPRCSLLAEITRALGRKGVRVPPGFILSASALRFFLHASGLLESLEKLLARLDVRHREECVERSRQARDLILHAPLPPDLEGEILRAYRRIVQKAGGRGVGMTVRTCPVGGQTGMTGGDAAESVMYAEGEYTLLQACKRVAASAFTPAALRSRAGRGAPTVNDLPAALVQRMVRADLAASGTVTSCDPSSGFPGVCVVRGLFGLPDGLRGGGKSPDEFWFHKETLRQGSRALMEKRRGGKETKVICFPEEEQGVRVVPVPAPDQTRVSVSDDEAAELARWSLLIEDLVGRPVEIEWAKDGDGLTGGSGLLFCLTARSHPVPQGSEEQEEYLFERPVPEKDVLLTGEGVGGRIGKGKVRVIPDLTRVSEFRVGEVLVTETTDPEWEPALRIAAALITNRGGLGSHAASVSRRLRLPCVVGTGSATAALTEGAEVTVDGTGPRGRVLRGAHPFRIARLSPDEIPSPKTPLFLFSEGVERVFHEASAPTEGIRLADDGSLLSRVGVHPRACIEFDMLRSRSDVDAQQVVREIAALAGGASRPAEYFVEALTSAIARLAAASSRETIVTLSPLSSREYAALLGGRFYEAAEAEPRLGLVGVSRFLHPDFEAAFALECEAVLRVREEMGFRGVHVAVPFCRTPEEGGRILTALAKHGLTQGERGFEVYLRVDVASQVTAAEQFADLFDGFVITTALLTDILLGLAPSSAYLAALHDERQEGVLRAISQIVRAARTHRPRRKVSLASRLLAEFPSLTSLFVEWGVDAFATPAVSLLPARVLVYFTERAAEEKKKLVVVENAGRGKRMQVRLGVSRHWLEVKAAQWAKSHAVTSRHLTAEERLLVASLLASLSPRLPVDQPDGTREILCWQGREADLAREEKVKGIRRVDVRPVGSLTARALSRRARLWLAQTTTSSPRSPALLREGARTKALLARYDDAHIAFLVERLADVVEGLVERENAR